MLLNQEWINNEIKEEIKRYLETNEKQTRNHSASMGHRKAVLAGKFIALQAYLKSKKNLN